MKNLALIVLALAACSKPSSKDKEAPPTSTAKPVEATAPAPAPATPPVPAPAKPATDSATVTAAKSLLQAIAGGTWSGETSIDPSSPFALLDEGGVSRPICGSDDAKDYQALIGRIENLKDKVAAAIAANQLACTETGTTVLCTAGAMTFELEIVMGDALLKGLALRPAMAADFATQHAAKCSDIHAKH